MMNKKPLTVQEMASMGGKARAAKLSPEERSRIAKGAVAARETKRLIDRANALDSDLEAGRITMSEARQQLKENRAQLAELRKQLFGKKKGGRK